MNSSFAQRSKILALGFYDGATEGFATLLRLHGTCYFKLVAWDDLQDQRLFAVAEIDAAKLEGFVETLNEPRESTAPVWIPDWKFRSDREQSAFDEFVSMCADQASYGGFLVLGRSIDSPEARELLVPAHARPAVAEAIRSESPRALSDWRSILA